MLNFFRKAKDKYIVSKYNIIKKSQKISNASKIKFSKNSSINDVIIEDNVSVGEFIGSLNSLTIGTCTYISKQLQVYGYNGDLSIGKFCSIAGKLSAICGDGYHQKKRLSTYPFPFRKPFNKSVSEKDFYSKDCFPRTKIIIGHDVWIGEDVLIAKGKSIGNGSIIAAKSVVTKDVKPYSIVAGNPAKEIKKRFPIDVINKIEELKWWEWSIDKIKQNLDLFTLDGMELINAIDQFKSKNYSINEKK